MQELNSSLVRQQREIRELRLELEGLRRELQDLSATTGAHPGKEPPPPHY